MQGWLAGVAGEVEHFTDNTVEPCYNEDLGTIKITLLYQEKTNKEI